MLAGTQPAGDGECAITLYNGASDCNGAATSLVAAGGFCLWIIERLMMTSILACAHG